ncbi:uncharacterized protein [Diadema setosum]|uniref:uncharacterized protein n=1 Tax=Diadema setosum TaxID=31175 RepID=UPI003B3A4598
MPGFSAEYLQEAQERDDLVNQVRSFVSRGTPPSREEKDSCLPGSLALLRDWKRLFLRNGVLLRRRRRPNDGTEHLQVIAPQSIQEKAITRFHDEAGHFGFRRTYRLVGDRFFWHGMEESVKQWCAKCKRCAVSKPPVWKEWTLPT